MIYSMEIINSIKSGSIASILILAMSSCVKEEGKDHIALRIEDKEEEIAIRIINQSDSAISIENAAEFSLSPNESGLSFLIKDQAGKVKNLCAMIDPGRDANEVIVTTVSSRQHLDKFWKKNSLARRYCLFPGRYSIRVILAQRGEIYTSNEIFFKNRYRP